MDACKEGVGYCIMQTINNKWHFIRCGSSTLATTQKGYNTYNLELLAICYTLTVSYIPAKHNQLADFVSCTATGSPQMSNVYKFISHAPTVASLNLIYDGKVLDI